MLKKRLTIFILVLALVLIILPFVVIMIYFKTTADFYFPYNIEGLSKILKPHSSNTWSNFGSLLSGLFTLFGSFATVGTLIFIIKQHNDNTKERGEQIIREEKISLANLKYMEIEKEKMTFEKYKLHKDMFIDVLKSAEEKIGGGVSIANKNELYRKIFPQNSFSIFEPKELRNQTTKISGLHELTELIICILTSIKSKDYFPNPDLMFSSCWEIRNTLGLRYNKPLRNGDIYYSDGSLFYNSFYFEGFINNLLFIINEIRHFAEQPPIIFHAINRFESIELQLRICQESYKYADFDTPGTGPYITFYTDNKKFTDIMRNITGLIDMSTRTGKKISSTRSYIMNLMMTPARFEKLTACKNIDEVRDDLIENLIKDKDHTKEDLEWGEIIDIRIGILRKII